jgi:peptide/nickel transport system substrate-binding protein
LETNAIGTGPYIMKEFDQATGYKVARNPNYWVKDQPYLDGVTGHYLADRGTVIAGFAADNLDMINVEDKVLFDSVQQLKPGLVYERFYGKTGYAMFFALDQAPYSDIRVRRAINLTADRQDMLVKGAFGEGFINPPGVYGWKKGYAIPPEDLVKLPGYNPATKQQDIAEGKRLLAEAGYPNGFSGKISYLGGGASYKVVAEVLGTQLQAVGINATLVPLDSATDAQVSRDESFEMYILGASGRDSRSEWFERFHSKGTFNRRGPKDPELDAILEKYQVEPDVPAAQKLAQQFQRRLYDQAYVIGAFERASYSIYQPWVHDMLNNYGASPVPYWWPATAWMDLEAMPASRRTER